jgi:hypothetical protein
MVLLPTVFAPDVTDRLGCLVSGLRDRLWNQKVTVVRGVRGGLNAMSVGEAVAAARADTIVHQMTGLSRAHAGKPDEQVRQGQPNITSSANTPSTERKWSATP